MDDQRISSHPMSQRRHAENGLRTNLLRILRSSINSSTYQQLHAIPCCRSGLRSPTNDSLGGTNTHQMAKITAQYLKYTTYIHALLPFRLPARHVRYWHAMTWSRHTYAGRVFGRVRELTSCTTTTSSRTSAVANQQVILGGLPGQLQADWPIFSHPTASTPSSLAALRHI